MRRLGLLLVGIVGAIAVAGCGGQEGIPIFFQSDRDGNWEIYSIWHDGTNLTRLTSNSVDDTMPAASADGTQVAFLRNEDGVVDIWVMNADGTGARNVTNGQVDGTIGSVSWFPDGRKFVASISSPDVADGRAQVYTINVDGTGQTRVSTDDELMYVHPKVHPQGGEIAVAAGPSEDSLDIHIIDTSGKLRNIVPRETFRTGQAGFDEPGIVEDYPDYDPTGRAIMFQSNVTGNLDLFRVEPDGRKVNSQTPDSAANELQPSWSGSLDRFWFAFASDRDGNMEIYRKNQGTKEVVRITNNPAQDTNPTWVKTPLE